MSEAWLQASLVIGYWLFASPRRMERAGQPRHRSQNPRGEGERAGRDRVNPSVGGSVIGALRASYSLSVNPEARFSNLGPRFSIPLHEL